MEALAKWLDFHRGNTLVWSNQLPLLRRLYANRTWRLGFLYLAAVAFYIPVCLIAPLVVLVVGPLVWGLPHLAASLRFVPRLISPLGNSSESENSPASWRWFVILASLSFTIVTGVRVYNYLHLDRSLSGTSDAFALEIAMAAMTVVTAFFIRPRPALWQIGLAGSLIAGLTALNIWIPLELAGALVLVHNLVAFIYWIAAAKLRSEKIVAWGATIIFVGVSVGMLYGVFDGIYKFVMPYFRIRALGIDYTSYGRMIATNPLADRNVLYHCVVAYAFGQAIHYFVWLKAIPDQLRGVQTPACFQQTWRYLARDFGVWGRNITAVVCVAGWVALPFIGFELWRILYFAGASFHGFFEIAGLGLIHWRRFMV